MLTLLGSECCSFGVLAYACLVCLLNASGVGFLKFMRLHHCISSRYARCATRGTKGQSWSRDRRWCTGRPIQKMEGLTGVHAWTRDDVKPVPDYKLTNWLCVKTRQAPEHVLYILNLCNLLLFLSTCAFKFTGVAWNLSCMILGTYAWTLVCIGR